MFRINSPIAIILILVVMTIALYFQFNFVRFSSYIYTNEVFFYSRNLLFFLSILLFFIGRNIVFLILGLFSMLLSISDISDIITYEILQMQRIPISLQGYTTGNWLQYTLDKMQAEIPTYIYFGIQYIVIFTIYKNYSAKKKNSIEN